MYRVAFKFNHEVQRVNNELTIPQNKKALQSKLLLENGKGSYNGKSMQNINHAYAPMDRKRAMMNSDLEVMPNGRLNIAKSPTNSVSMTQLYRDKQMSGAVPMHSEPSLSTMYYSYMIQQTSDFEKSIHDFAEILLLKGKNRELSFEV